MASRAEYMPVPGGRQALVIPHILERGLASFSYRLPFATNWHEFLKCAISFRRIRANSRQKGQAAGGRSEASDKR